VLRGSLAPSNFARTVFRIEIALPFSLIFQVLQLVETGKMSRERLILQKFMQRTN
jgi:hypothetical protein